MPDVDPAEIEGRLVAATRSWDDDFADALAASAASEEASRLAAIYGEAFPEAYKEDLPAARGRRRPAPARGADERRATSTCSLYSPRDAAPGERRLKIFHVGEPVSLSLVLPVLQQMGVEVVDERPYEIDRGRPRRRVGLRLRAALRAVGRRRLGQTRGPAFQDAFARRLDRRGGERRVQRARAAGRADLAPGDGAARLRQVPAPGRSTFSQDYIEDCLPPTSTSRGCWSGSSRRGSTLASDDGGASEVIDGLHARRSSGALDAVAEPRRGPHPARASSAVHPGDAAHQLLPARRRTADPSPTSRMKLDPAARAGPARAAADVRDLGLLARGSRACTCASARSPAAACAGPTAGRTSAPRCSAWSRRRWSRTPSSCRSAPRAGSSSSGRPTATRRPRGLLAEGIACYRTFICGLLDVTDNLRRRRGRAAAATSCATTATTPTSSSPPTRARRRSPTSPTRSRIDYGFWLGDAFASGGSAGYDHKAMGITARGAWESVQAALPRARRRHPDRGLHRASASATCPATCSATACCSPSTSGWSPRSTTATSSSTPNPDAASVVRRAPPAVRPAALVLGRLRREPDLRGRRRLPAHREVDPADAAGARGARHRRQRRRD